MKPVNWKFAGRSACLLLWSLLAATIVCAVLDFGFGVVFPKLPPWLGLVAFAALVAVGVFDYQYRVKKKP